MVSCNLFLCSNATKKIRIPAAQRAPRGFTLVEMLVGMAVTLVMMAAVVNLFANLGSGVRVRRANMEMGGQLRMVRARLFKDLANATCRAVPKTTPGDDTVNDGYLEIIDGLWSDSVPSILTDGTTDDDFGELDYASSLVPSSNLPLAAGRVTDGGALGDQDNILALTVRSEGEPFVGRMVFWNNSAGRWEATTIESDLAEVIWYLVENPADGSLGEPGMRTLYRRVLLIAPSVDLPPTTNGTAAENVPDDLAYYRMCDVSFRHELGRRIPNTLADLMRRENRFAHRRNMGGSGLGWPFVLDQNVIRLLPFDADNPPGAADMTSPLRPFGRPFERTDDILPPNGTQPNRTGEDLMLSDVLAFDLRVFDPGAPLVKINGKVLEPTDPGWNPQAAGAAVVGYGAFVDLGWDPSFLTDTSFFPNPPPPRYNYDYANPPIGVPEPLFKEPHTPGWHPRFVTGPGYGYWATYDTWAGSYEADGIDQDNFDNDNDPRTGADEGIDSFDNNNDGKTNEPGERETWPPYNVPLQGMQAKIRIYERNTRQIREATVTRHFND